MKNRGFLFSLVTFTALLLFLVTACGSPTERGAETEVVNNTLTESEISEGWILMFDGETSTGWRGYNRTGFPEGWVVEDGTLFCKDGGGDIIYDGRKFLEFHLKLDWKISEGGNSGVFYFVQELEGRSIWHSAPELQLLDNDAYDNLNPCQYAPALYDLVAPDPDNTTRPAGEWNTVEVIVKDKHITHIQNGVEVVSIRMGTDEWNSLVEESKFPDDLFAQYIPGFIGLQDHGDQVWFRNLKIKEL